MLIFRSRNSRFFNSLCRVIFCNLGGSHFTWQPIFVILRHPPFFLMASLSPKPFHPRISIMFSSFSLSTHSFPTLHSALEKSLGKVQRTFNEPTPQQFTILRDSQAFFVGPKMACVIMLPVPTSLFECMLSVQNTILPT